jgi:hypothetical protein
MTKNSTVLDFYPGRQSVNLTFEAANTETEPKSI